jgi:hypothetical protein
MKHLGKKPPHAGIKDLGVKCSCLSCVAHYRQALLEAAVMSEKDCINGIGDGHITCIKAKYVILCNRCNLAKKMRISAGIKEAMK